jgi:hypothetical protein
LAQRQKPTSEAAPPSPLSVSPALAGGVPSASAPAARIAAGEQR